MTGSGPPIRPTWTNGVIVVSVKRMVVEAMQVGPKVPRITLDVVVE
jgi:hypothetical protein